MSFNVGAILNMWAFLPSELTISSLSENTCVVTSSVSLDDRLVPCIRQTVLPVAKFEDDDNGGFWQLEISGSMPEISLAARQKINAVLLRRCIIVVQNTNGDHYLFGSSSSPMIPSAVDRKQPEKISDATFYGFKLSSQAISEPLIISSFA